MAHHLIQERISPGDVVVDATVGNGYDTLFLARCVTPGGRVIGFDIQEEALEQTATRCAGLSNIELHRMGHEHLGETISETVSAVMFNLGYLPGSDRAITTSGTTTVPALKAALSILRESGIVTLVVYTGHPGGLREAESLTSFIATLDQKHFVTAKYEFVNRTNSPPFLLVIEKQVAGNDARA